jgi:replicative DNA helicase
VKLSEEMSKGRGVKFGFSIDDRIVPARPGKVTTIVGRPGHSKSSLMAAVAKHEANEILRYGEQTERYVGYVTFEQPVEELDAYFQTMHGFNTTDLAWGRVDIETIRKNSINRANLPVWLFGKSIYESSFKDAPLTIERLYDAIEAIYDKHGLLPSALFIDYIQRINVPSETERYMQVTKAVHLVRQLAAEAKCPIFLGAQANQRVDDKATPIPAMNSIEWSAVIGQDSDTVLALWKPIRNISPWESEYIKVGNHMYRNDNNLLVLKLLKQRWDSGHGIWAADMDMATLEIRDAKPVSASAANAAEENLF